MTSQDDPNRLMKIGKKIMGGWTGLKKDLGQAELIHHPTTKLKEAVPQGLARDLAQPLPATGREKLVQEQQAEADRKMKLLENSYRRR